MHISAHYAVLILRCAIQNAVAYVVPLFTVPTCSRETRQTRLPIPACLPHSSSGSQLYSVEQRPAAQ